MRADYLANPAAYPQPVTHFRHTFPTLSPPLALEQLLAQLRARWTPVRAGARAGTGAGAPSGSQGAAAGQMGASAGPQLTVEGYVYAIGSDWLVRAGNVILSGGAVKGMLMEVCCRCRRVGGVAIADVCRTSRWSTFRYRPWRRRLICSLSSRTCSSRSCPTSLTRGLWR